MSRRLRSGATRPQNTACSKCKRDLDVEEVGKFAKCERCRGVAGRSRRLRIHQYIAEGVCVYCRAELATDPYRDSLWEGATRCSLCYFRCVSRDHFGTQKFAGVLKVIFELQRGRCAITGEKLVLLGNASLDHRIPKARGGSLNPDNVWWVTKLANGAKTNMTPVEHVAFSQQVVAYYYSAEYRAMTRRLKRAQNDDWQAVNRRGAAPGPPKIGSGA